MEKITINKKIVNDKIYVNWDYRYNIVVNGERTTDGERTTYDLISNSFTLCVIHCKREKLRAKKIKQNKKLKDYEADKLIFEDKLNNESLSDKEINQVIFDKIKEIGTELFDRVNLNINNLDKAEVVYE